MHRGGQLVGARGNNPIVADIIVNNLSVLVNRPLCTVLMVLLQRHCNRYLIDVVDVIVNDC